MREPADEGKALLLREGVVPQGQQEVLRRRQVSLVKLFPRLDAFLKDVQRIREALERLSPPDDLRHARKPFWK